MSGYDIDTIRLDELEPAVRAKWLELRAEHPRVATARALAEVAGEQVSVVEHWAAARRPIIKLATLHRYLEAIRVLETRCAEMG